LGVRLTSVKNASRTSSSLAFAMNSSASAVRATPALGSGRDRLHARRRIFRTRARFVSVLAARQRDAHAPLLEAFRLAEQAHIALRNAQRLSDALERNPLRFHAAINHRTRTRRAQRRVDGQAQNGARMQRELALVLARERHQS